MSAQTQPRLTPQQYLELERAAEFRHEYYNGRIYAMSGGSYNHVRAIANFSYELTGALKNKACEVGSSDLRVQVSPEGLYTYPDIVVTCGKPEFADGKSDTLTNPVLLGEVLSPSTEGYDRGFKFEQYRKIASLKEFVLISQFLPHVEVFRKKDGGVWYLSDYNGMNTSFELTSIDCIIPIAGIYDKIAFESDPSHQPAEKN
jgi:Uma2 family endonuclease